MAIATLRRWGGAVAVSLPKKILSMLDLKAGAKVDVKINAGSIVLSPKHHSYTLNQLIQEQKVLERHKGGPLVEREWAEDIKRGRELL
jgi:antitoxin component of MazEF toxin-antitoxin module